MDGSSEYSLGPLLAKMEQGLSIGTQKLTSIDPVAIGDVVVVQESDQPREFWKLAKVENLITGSDGLVRGVRIRTQTAGNRPTYLQRPVQLLYPLEVHSLEGSDNHGFSGTTVPSDQSPDANGNGGSERLSS